MEKVESFEHVNKRITIYYDPDPVNPVKEYEELTEMACWHRRANLGHRQIEGCSKEEMIESLKEQGEEVLAILPLYLYEHSGMTISTGSFSCSFDSGQVGWAYVTASSAEKMGCTGPAYKQDAPGQMTLDGMWDTARLEKAIEGDVKTYDCYLRGECFGYDVKGADGEIIDSCWGYLGDLEYCKSEARSAAEHGEDPAVLREVAFLESRPTYAGIAS